MRNTLHDYLSACPEEAPGVYLQGPYPFRWPSLQHPNDATQRLEAEAVSCLQDHQLSGTVDERTGMSRACPEGS